MTHLTFAYPGDLETRTGGYAYDRRMIDELRALGWTVDPVPLGPGFPYPDAATLARAGAALSALTDAALVMIDGLALGVMDDWAAHEAARLNIVALVHHPLALEGGLAPATEAAFRRTERRALAAARAVVVTSDRTAADLAAGFDVARERVTVARPGTDPGARAVMQSDVPRILSIGTLIQRKGHDVLIDALARIRDLAWTARIIGSDRLDPVVAGALRDQIGAAGFGDRIELVGAVDDPRDALAGAQIFALASRFEGYGMVFAEALAHGLPIVACDAGAIPEVVPADAAFLVPPDDPRAFADRLARLLRDPALRDTMADAAARAGSALPAWHDSARIVAQTLSTIARHEVAR